MIQPDSDSLLLPRESKLEGISVAFQGAAPLLSAIGVRLRSGGAVDLNRTSIGWRVPGDVPLGELQEIAVTTGDGAARASRDDHARDVVSRRLLPRDDAGGRLRATRRRSSRAPGIPRRGPELVEHLRANALYYNQAIWRSFDASTVALLLSGFSFEELPVADLIDPQPLQVAGNYLVFRMPGFVARVGLRTRPTTARTRPKPTPPRMARAGSPNAG